MRDLVKATREPKTSPPPPRPPPRVNAPGERGGGKRQVLTPKGPGGGGCGREVIGRAGSCGRAGHSGQWAVASGQVPP